MLYLVVENLNFSVINFSKLNFHLYRSCGIEIIFSTEEVLGHFLSENLPVSDMFLNRKLVDNDQPTIFLLSFIHKTIFNCCLIESFIALLLTLTQRSKIFNEANS